mgnify:CR=1 FL=1
MTAWQAMHPRRVNTARTSVARCSYSGCPQRAETLRPRLYDTDTNSTYNLLNNVAGVLPLANRDGWWHLDLDYILSDLKVFDAAITERLDETYDGVAYTRGFKRRDMIRLQQIVRHLRKIGQSPP